MTLDKKISELDSLTSLPADDDLIPIVDVDALPSVATLKTTRQNFLGITGTVVGTDDVQILTNKTVLDKGELVFDIKAYGAVVNGSTDDASSVQSAIDAAESAGGGEVHFPGGTTLIGSTLTIDSSNVILRGIGDASVIKLKNSSNVTLVTITGSGVVNCGLRNLKLDGNKGNQSSTCYGITINTDYVNADSQHIIDNVDVWSTYDSGIYITGDTRVVRLKNVRVKSSGNTAYSLGGSDHILTDCVADAAVANGFYTTGGNVKLNSCKAFYCDTGLSGGCGFFLGGARPTLVNCEAQDNYEIGVYLNGANNAAITGLMADSNGQNGGTSIGLAIDSTNYVSVSGGSFFDRGANLNPQKYGIRITGTSTGCVTAGGTFHSNATLDYEDVSSGTNQIGVTNNATQTLTNKTLDSTSPTAFVYPGFIQPYAGFTAPNGWLLAYGQTVSRSTYAALFAAIVPTVGTFTVTIASPAVVTLTAHGFVTGSSVYLTTTGALPTGLSANTLYYVIKIDADTFNLATSRANAYASTKINTSGSQSGTHTINHCSYGLGDGSTTFTIPDLRGRTIAGGDAMGGTAASRLALGDSTGTYGNTGSTGGAETASNTLSDSSWAQAGYAAANPNLRLRNITADAWTANIGLQATGATAAANSDSGLTRGIALRGTTDAGNNIQPTIVINYLIKT